MGLTDKVIVLTGATAGLGPGIARALAGAGARLCLADTGSAELAKELDAVFVAIDPVSPAALLTLCERLADTLGPPDAVIVNLALPTIPRAPESVAEADFDMALQRLIRPVFLTARAFLPSLRARGTGAILTVASRPGPARQARDVWTMAALGWLTAATGALAAEVAGDGLRVNALLPAQDDTPSLPKFLGARATSAPPPPLGRYPSGADAGAAAVFLCSDAAATITGLCLPLDAGRHL